MTTRLATLVLACSLLPLAAQEKTANPLSADARMVYGMFKGNILKAAEKMPEDQFSFRPTDSVRTFGQLLGHIADSSYGICGRVTGEAKQMGIEKSKTSKADLVQALNEGFAFCDAAYDGMTDAKAAEMVSFFGGSRTKLAVLYFNAAHLNEHYGNIATYLRIKNLVPPSSERR